MCRTIACLWGLMLSSRRLDTLRPGDIAIFATPAAFRAAHFEYAISRGLHVFMEKPVAVDGPSAKELLISPAKPT